MESVNLTIEQFDQLLTIGQSQKDTADETSDSQFIRQLAAIDRSTLSQLMREQHFYARDIIFQEGEAGEALFLIRSGRVIVIKGHIDAPVILGYRGVGEVVGEMALLEGGRRSATVIALEDLRLLKINRQDFLRLRDANPEVGQRITASLSARLREADLARQQDLQTEKALAQQLTSLQNEREQLLMLQRVQQETSDLIIHDLRNPLNLMHSAVQMLELTLPEEVLKESEELIAIANTAYRRMQRLVDSLLDVARMETGSVEMRRDIVDFETLIRDVALQAKFSVEKRKINLTLEIEDGLPPITLDEDKIVRTVANLVDNAIKFMPGGGDLTITAVSQHDHLLVSIADSGPGVPEKDRQRIFERFAQTEGEEKMSRGFGLGLAFCRLAVEAHNGRIWVESGNNDVGSVFKFTLPLNG